MSNKRRNTQEDWAPAFLAAFADEMTIKAACKTAGINRTTFYRRKQSDEEFALAFHDLNEDLIETLEREAHRRAVEGVIKPVYYQGVAIGGVKEFSDSLLVFLLKARRPEMYRERFDVQHGGAVKHDHAIDPSKLSDEELEFLERIRARTSE